MRTIEEPLVILCGDHPPAAPLVGILTGSLGATLVRAPEGLEGFTEMVDRRPDLIITPFPGDETLATFLRRKEKSQLNPVPLVIMMERHDPVAAAALLDRGADAVIDPKMLDPLHLPATLRALLRQYARFRELQQANYDNIRLFKLTRRMHSILNIEELVNVVTEEARLLLDVDQINLLLLDQQPGEQGKLFVNSGGLVKRKVVEAIMHDFAGWIRKLRLNRDISRSVILKYVPRSGFAGEKATDELLNIVFTNYLKAKDEFIGIMNLLDTEKKELSQGEIALTSALSQQLAFSLKNILLLETLNFLARKDELTQLFNRRYFNERFTDEFLRNRRYGSFFSCILSDLDHFKRINDTWGHQQGDEVLRAFGQVIRDGIRCIDIAARYGGEEFILLLPETDTAGALLVAERIRAAIGSRKFRFPEPVTSSFGICCSRDAGITDRQEMIRRADVALYRAKHLGRNRSVVYEASLEIARDGVVPGGG